MNRFLPFAAAALAVAASPQLASANFVMNGGFEADADGTTGLPSGWTSLESGVSAEVVTSPVVEGAQAIRLSGTLPTSGAFSDGLKYQFFPTPASETFVVGQSYQLTGDVTFDAAASGASSSAQIAFIDYDASAGGYGNFNPTATATVDASNLSDSVDATFTYRGGAVDLALRLYGAEGETSVATFDNFSITVVPEPASFAVLASMGVLALRRRRA